MISFQQVSKQFGSQVVLQDASFQVNPGEHVGIVGPNGAGKSTVFNLIIGELEPDKGRISVPDRFRLGYVRQQLDAHKITASLLEYAENAVPELQGIQAEIHTLEDELHRTSPSAPDNRSPTTVHPVPLPSFLDTRPSPLLRRLGELQSKFEHMGGYALKNRAERSLCGLGFAPDVLDQPLRTFSGGWQSRAELARILVAEPDVLLLDEPSNYLDIPTIEWLQRYLKEFAGTLLLISHDRFLLNSLTTVTIEIANTRAERYPGNYDYYSRERKLRYEQRLAAQKNQDRKREQVEKFIERFRYKNTWSSQVQSRIKMLEKLEDVTLPQRIVSPGKIRLRPPPHSGAEVMRLEEAGLTYDQQRWVLRGVDLSVMRGEKLALIGLNGLGKTTLLRMLAGKLPISEGKRVIGHKVQIGYQSQDFAETMDPNSTVYGTVRTIAPDVSEQETRTLLGGFGFSGDTIEKYVSVLSGGEKIRLAFARLLIKPPNFLILDEPTTHLDIQARESLEEALQDYQGTICLVSHDIDFVRHIANGIIAMTPPGITRYAGGYDYYHEKVDSVQVSGVSGKKEDVSRRGAEHAERKKAAGVGLPSPLVPRPSSLDTRHSSLGPTKADRKELRKQRAEARAALYDKTKDLKKAIRRAEMEVERLEKEKAELVKQLSSPLDALPSSLDTRPSSSDSGHSTPAPRPSPIASLGRRLQQVQYEIDIATSNWEKATESLEKVVGGEAGEE